MILRNLIEYTYFTLFVLLFVWNDLSILNFNILIIMIFCKKKYFYLLYFNSYNYFIFINKIIIYNNINFFIEMNKKNRYLKKYKLKENTYLRQNE